MQILIFTTSVGLNIQVSQMVIIVITLCSFIYAAIFILNDHLISSRNEFGFAPPFLASFFAVLLFIVPTHMDIEFSHQIFYITTINIIGILIYFVFKKFLNN